MRKKIIKRWMHSTPSLQLRKIGKEELPFNSIRMIEIHLCTLRRRQMRKIAIVLILRNNKALLPQKSRQSVHNFQFPSATSATNSNLIHVITPFQVVYTLQSFVQCTDF